MEPLSFSQTRSTLRLPRLSHYYLLGLIGQGQYGRVFCAYDYNYQTIVAIKVINQRRLTTQQFLRELRFLVELNHPQLVACQGLQHLDSQRYLIMDYCEGGTLRNLIESQSLTWSQSLEIVKDLLLGLEYIHHRQIIHCDLKPDNILLTLISGGWRAKISDFGIAKDLQEKNNSLSFGDTGSPAYMAPERFYGKLGVTSDLYAVGIILYELLVGDRPFSGTPQEIIAAHLNQTVNIPSFVPFLLRSFITKALQKLPQHRFQSAEEMRKSLQIATEVIVAENLSASTPQISKSSDSVRFNCSLVSTFTQPLPAIASNHQRLYLPQEQQILCQTSPTDTFYPVILSGKLHKLQISPQGCLIWTENNPGYTLHHLVAQELRKIWQTSSQVLVTDSGANNHYPWLVLADFELQPQLTIIKLRESSSISHPLSALPTQLLQLDSQHGLAVFTTSSHTQFNLFNRRGHWYPGFSLAIACKQLAVSLISPYTLVGVEANSNSGLFIQLRPLLVSRFPLSFIPDFIVPQSWGYFLASRGGKILALDANGNFLTQTQISRQTITAVAAINQETILLATYEEGESHLHQISLKN